MLYSDLCRKKIYYNIRELVLGELYKVFLIFYKLINVGKKVSKRKSEY